ncbi:MAG TPA: histidine kinase [Ginsengibacter sp.]
MSLKLFILFSLVIVGHSTCLSQNKTAALYRRCSIKTLNYEQGLLNNGTTNIITDVLGFTWISTKTGMQRYNGYVLKTINPVIANKQVNINSSVYFFGLKNGLIWISYKMGVLQYDPHENSFKKIISTDNADNLNFSLIPFKETNEGILCLQHNKGLVFYSPGGTLKSRLHPDDTFIQNVFDQQEILSNTTFTINKNSIFIYNGINKILQVNFYTGENNYINADSVNSFTCSDSHLYIISNSDLKSINITSKQIEKDIFLNQVNNESVNRSSCSFPDSNQLLVSLNAHLFEFDSVCNYKKEYTDFSLNPVAEPGFIKTIYPDGFKRIWLLTNDNIKRIQDFEIPFRHFIYTNEKNNFIRSLYYDETKHLLLAGCYNGGIQLFDTLGNALWQNALTADNVKDINGIEKLDDNNYFIETISRGLYILNLPSKKITPFLTDIVKGVIDYGNMNFINNLQRINDSTIFITTTSNVFRCIIANDKLKYAEPLLTFNKIQQIDCFIYARDKVLWVGTVSGSIYKVVGNKQPETIQIPENYQIRSFSEDAKQNIWVGTDKGLYVYRSSGSFLKKFTIESGLLNDCIYATLPIENKTAVYASSNLGLSYISLDDSIINYTKESGLQENEFNTESAVKTLNGKFYFGGVNGITAFYPAALSDIKDHPVLNITQLSINDSLYTFSAAHWRNDSIFLSHNENHLQLDIGALGLLNTNEYKYQYRLKGFDERWQTTRTPTGIKYVLQPGQYVFQISCSPVFSSGSIFTKSFLIIVSPAWWQTTWFEILLMVLFAGAISLVVQQYIRRRYLQKIRGLELQQQIQRERERISRDLHDNLGAYAAAIASNVSAMKNISNENDQIILNQLQNNSQSIINQLNDTIWTLNKESISLTIISDRFKVFLQKIQPNYPKVNIEIREEIINDIALSPVNALHLFRIMQEAINNALRHSDCANLLLTITSSDTWKIIIKDDGKGMQKLNEKKSWGNGLQNIKLRSKETGWQVIWKEAYPTGTELIISSSNTN